MPVTLLSNAADSTYGRHVAGVYFGSTVVLVSEPVEAVPLLSFAEAPLPVGATAVPQRQITS